jgi:hypothetical protein
MPDLTFSKADIPIWQGGDGTITIHANIPQLNQPLPTSTTDLLTIDFGITGNQTFTFGEPNNIKLGVQAGTKARLAVFWPTSTAADMAILADYGLDKFFSTHPDNLILGLLIDANAALTAAGSAVYSVLTVSATLDAGGDVAYAYLRSYIKSETFDQIAKDFFHGLELPATVESPLTTGEVISIDYNGYLKIGAGLSVGYEMKGAPSFTIGQLQLSEHYDLSVVGKLSISAGIAGEFSVQVSAAENPDGSPMTGWIHVVVTKKKTSQFGIAADVSIDASSQLQGLPDTGSEFLGALLGVQAKNWLNLFAKIEQLSDFKAIQQELDGLAANFLDEWIGKAFDALSTTEFASFMQTVQTVVNSYENLDNSAITLFDKYFDKLDVLTSKLNQLAALTSWSQLKGEINNDLWDVVQQLTDGDPLGWILGQVQIPGPNGPVTVPSLQQLAGRVQQTLALIQQDENAEIRKVIALAKSSFGLDGFFQQLEQIDSIPKLKAIAEQKLGAFVQRLLGKAIDQMSNSELGAAVTRIHKVLTSVQNFENNLYAQFKAAANQSLDLSLHAEYDRATENDALIDMCINLSTDQGKQLIQAAGRGDFQAALAAYQPDLVRLNRGLLTHNITKSTSFSINVIGWHGGWHYQGSDSVVLNTQQQIVPENNAALTVYSTIDMSQQTQRQRMSETVLTNLTLRFLGESHGVLAFDKENQQYLIDSITGMAASYELSFASQQTNAARLEYYLSFARDFGLVDQGATINNLLPLLPSVGANNFGPISVDYQVRYTEAALRRLFSAPFNEATARQIMRKLVLASYLRDAGLTGLGWCYWTVGIYSLWKQGQAEFTNHSQLQFGPIDQSPFAQMSSPPNVVLQQNQLQVLSTLYYIEDDFIDGLQALDHLIHSAQIQPQAFENALGGIGSALDSFKNFSEGVNAVFGLFDQLVQQQTPGPEARVSTMDLKSTVTGKTVEKVFLAGVSLPQIASPSAAAAAP